MNLNQKINTAFAQYIKLRDRYRCKICSHQTKKIPNISRRYNSKLVDAIESSIITRTKKAMECAHRVNRHHSYLKWFDGNADCMCVTCHKKTENSSSYYEAPEELLSLATQNETSQKYLVFGKEYSKYEKKEILKVLKDTILNLR